MQGDQTSKLSKMFFLDAKRKKACKLTHNNCYYLDRLNLKVSATQYEPIKGRSGDGGLTASPIIKLAKDGEEEMSTRSWNYLPSPRGGSS